MRLRRGKGEARTTGEGEEREEKKDEDGGRERERERWTMLEYKRERDGRERVYVKENKYIEKQDERIRREKKASEEKRWREISVQGSKHIEE